MITRLAVSGYRSLRDVRLTLGRLTVVTGANGSGKSSLYRSLRLLADVAQGRVVQSLAQEGGIQSTLWAGPKTIAASVKRGEHAVEPLRPGTVSLKLGFAGDDYGYAIDLGYPPPIPPSMFSLDPQIKVEALWTSELLGRSNLFAERRGPSVRIRDSTGEWGQASTTLASFDSMMTHCADPRDGVELLTLREHMRDWRFYDQLRTDRDAPARRPQVGTYTPVLDGDGSNLAAALQTVREIGDAEGLRLAIDDAFPGSGLEILSNDGWFEVEMRQHGLLRALRTAELSDGTLRYLLLVAALMSPRPPALMVLNEPETSLHPDLLGPLARLIAGAAERSQVVVVSHAAALVEALEEIGGRRVGLAKSVGGDRRGRRAAALDLADTVTDLPSPLRGGVGGGGGSGQRSTATAPYAKPHRLVRRHPHPYPPRKGEGVCRVAPHERALPGGNVADVNSFQTLPVSR